MSVRRDPIRIIYAKLTSTGSYDVVARTANIELSAARTLAEKLLPGNVPHGTTIEEDVGYVHPDEGGHLIFRYARYGWSGDNRGEIYMTDILWLDDADFARARANPFALVPRTDAVFETLTELPAPVIPERSAADDAARLSALSGNSEAAAAIIAGTLAAAPVLIIEPGDRAALAELFMLLLPPSLRTAFTFQTRAFRAPPFPPRLTLTDSYYASLHAGPWQKVLPDIAVDVPIDLARRLTELARQPERLARVHALYDRIQGKSKDLRAETTRVAALADFVAVLETGNIGEGVRRAAQRPEAESSVMVAELVAQVEPARVGEALTQLVDDGEAGQRIALLLLTADRGSRIADRGTDAGAGEQLGLVADRVIASNRLPQQELLLHLVERLAAAGDANRVVRIIALDRRTIVRLLPDFTDRAPAPLANYVNAVRALGTSKRALQAAAELADATAGLNPLITDSAALAALGSLCRESIHSAVEKAEINAENITDLVALDLAADRVLGTGPRLQQAVPQLLSDAQVRAVDDKALASGAALENSYPPNSIAVIGGSLLLRAVRAKESGATGEPSVRRLVAASRGALGLLNGNVQQQLWGALERLSIRAHTLVELPDANDLLPLLGHDSKNAAVTHQIVSALASIGDGDSGIALLASAVLRARTGRYRLTRSQPAFESIRSALSAACGRQHLDDTHEWPELELSLDLLAVICDGEASAALEEAVLIKGGMLIRLRRLDRALMQCETAGEPDIYERLARAIESPETPLPEDTRDRLREALGTRGIERRLTRLIAGVMDKDAG